MTCILFCWKIEEIIKEFLYANTIISTHLLHCVHMLCLLTCYYERVYTPHENQSSTVHFIPSFLACSGTSVYSNSLLSLWHHQFFPLHWIFFIITKPRFYFFSLNKNTIDLTVSSSYSFIYFLPLLAKVLKTEVCLCPLSLTFLLLLSWLHIDQVFALHHVINFLVKFTKDFHMAKLNGLFQSSFCLTY